MESRKPSSFIPHSSFSVHHFSPLLALLLLRKVFLSHAAKFRRRSERDFYGTRATVGRGHFSSRAERSQRESATLLQRPEGATSKRISGCAVSARRPLDDSRTGRSRARRGLDSGASNHHARHTASGLERDNQRHSAQP